MDICCGIVLYNPDIKRLKKNIRAIKCQVPTVFLVDNKSRNIDDVKKIIFNSENVILIENKENKGIAFALNQIMEIADDNGYKWVLSLDQDSICAMSLIQVYQEYLNLNIGIICPRIVDLNMYEDKLIESVEEIHDSTKVITSGSLVQVTAWKNVGKYDNRLFIDYVDTDFQERLLRKNYKIIRLSKTYILHEIGKMKKYKFGSICIRCSNHSAFRRYYMVRNRLYFKKKYFGWKGYIKEKLRLLLGDIKILMFEGDKVSKIRASFRGYRDYRNLFS